MQAHENNGVFQTVVWTGLGSNAADAQARLEMGRAALSCLDGVREFAVSPVYRTQPQDYAEQPFFCNQVLALLVAARWTPVSFMRAVLDIETRLGRVRCADPRLRFGPRVIDIDILLWGEDGEQISNDPVCVLPHPRLTRRAFWLVPLRDMAPGLTIQGKGLDALLAQLAWKIVDNCIFQVQPGATGANNSRGVL